MRLSRIGSVLGGWPLALACLLLAGVSAAHASPPKSASAAITGDVVVAAHDLSAGATIGGADVRLTSWPIALRPVAAITAVKIALGRRVVAAVGSGELITTTRLIGTDLSAGLGPGMVAVPVPLVDSAADTLIHAGDYIDLLSPPADTTNSAVTVAQTVLVLAVVASDSSSSAANAQLIVAVDRATELRIAQVITSPMLATLIKPP